MNCTILAHLFFRPITAAYELFLSWILGAGFAYCASHYKAACQRVSLSGLRFDAATLADFYGELSKELV